VPTKHEGHIYTNTLVEGKATGMKQSFHLVDCHQTVTKLSLDCHKTSDGETMQCYLGETLVAATFSQGT